MPNWFNRKKQAKLARYSFSAEGDIFITEQEDKEKERYEAEEKFIGSLPNQDGIRINNYNITLYSREF